ncbi:MAG: cytidylate kinase-like family protein [bacterium]|nr:cytidylate kinase-like family protein [bacterium]
MGKASLTKNMKEDLTGVDEDAANAGPFITISRQFGCHGFSVGLLLLDLLNDGADPDESWKIYHRDILTRLATETDLAEEIIERQRRARPRLFSGFLKSLGKGRIPSGMQIRNQITTIIRGLAIDGQAIIIGQGGSGATMDLPNGLSVRLEGPEDWRVKQVAFRDGLSETQARMRIRAKEREREYLRKLYQAKYRRTPAFNLLFDCSEFSLAQIAQQILYALKLKGCIPKR